MLHPPLPRSVFFPAEYRTFLVIGECHARESLSHLNITLVELEEPGKSIWVGSWSEGVFEQVNFCVSRLKTVLSCTE